MACSIAPLQSHRWKRDTQLYGAQKPCRVQQLVPGNSAAYTAFRRRQLGQPFSAAAPDQDSELEEEPETLFNSNPAFAAVLKGALQRQGKETLTKGPPAVETPKVSPAEEVLTTALRQARRNVLRLEALKKQIEAAIELEEQQFERIHFGLRRATADFAYIRTLDKLLAQEKEKNRDMGEPGLEEIEEV